MKTKKTKANGRVAAHDLETINAVGYVRVSTDGQGNHGISLDLQRVSIKAFADHEKFNLIEICGDVATAMGSKSVDNRPGLRRALELAVENDAYLIVYDYSRLTRHAASYDAILAVLPDPKRILDAKTGTSFSDAAKAGELARNEAAGRMIGQRTKEGMQKRRDEGAVFGNPDIATAQKKGAAAVSNKAAKLDAEIAKALRATGTDYLDLSYADAAELLNRHGLRTSSGKPWDK